MGSVRSVSLTTATAIAVADMIGIGVFTSLGYQVKDIPSGFSLLMLWLVGGVVALCGALSYAELATAFPRSGGEYNYLSRIYGRLVGFMAGWISATIGFAAPIALAAMAFGQYFAGVVPGAPPLALAIGVVWGVTIVHLAGVEHGSAFHNAATCLKVALIVIFIVAGFIGGGPAQISFAPTAEDLTHIVGAPFALSLVFVLYSYSGWNAATYIAGEVHRPQQVLPRSALLAVITVTALYMGLNAVFLYTTPISELAGQLDVAIVAGRSIFGEAGARIVGAMICLGLVSSISAMTWIGPRVTMVMGEDVRAVSFFARTTQARVPSNAILLQLAVVTALLLTQTFESILDYIQFSLTLCSFLAVSGVIVLRITQPGLTRPYRVWAYPVTPIVFLAVTLFMMAHLVLERPVESFAGLATMAAGLIVYALSARFSPSAALERS